MQKALIVFVICLSATVQLLCQTLFTFGPYAVSKEEFLRAYNKNKTAVTDKEQSLKEYLDLYSRFKLKVKTAQDQRLDTMQQLNYDLQNFRSQIAETYMNDQNGLNGLVTEALQRGEKDIHLLHVSIEINAAAPADTAKAYQLLKEAADQLRNIQTPDSAIVAGVAAKYPGVKIKDMGYITALSLPYEVESMVYALKPGDITGTWRSRSGLHIFKDLEERKSPGRWKIAQILLSLPPNSSAAELTSIRTKADSIYKLLVNGADFSTLAKQVSEDKSTYLNGGEMPEFGTGKFDLPFENKVFELKKDGDISKPVLTAYGFHIIKRLQQQDISAGRPDEAFMASLKQQVLQDARVNGVKAAFLKTIQAKTAFKRINAVKDADLFRYADSVAATGAIGKYPINNKPVFSFAKLTVKGSDWLNFVKDYKLNADVYKGEPNKELLDKFISTTSFDYYRKHLEEYNSDFKQQLEEFKEGNMLFEIMERNVWTRATNDSIGLETYYNEHKSNYKWAASADLLLFNAADAKVLEDAIIGLKDGKNWRQLADDSEGKLQADSGRFELAQMQIPADITVSEDMITHVSKNSGDNTSGFVKVLKLFPAGQQRSFEEARGLVINDYQGFLEEKWIAALKKKYPVKVNDAVFKALLK